jgi:hypothetical protein
MNLGASKEQQQAAPIGEMKNQAEKGARRTHPLEKGMRLAMEGAFRLRLAVLASSGRASYWFEERPSFERTSGQFSAAVFGLGAWARRPLHP